VSKKGSIPYRVVRTNESAFSFAGIWEEYEDTSGNMVHTFRIITVAAPPSMSHLGETVPVILDENTESKWLDPELSPDDLLQLLVPYPESELHIYTVSSRISNNKVDSPDLILAAPAADQFGNYSLFD
jgi:putative SOS response-associated peptidase YedK